MLQSIRNRSQGWFAWAIVVLITIPFALWGIQQYLGGGREPAAATVNGVEIPQREVQRVAQRQRQQLLRAMGANAAPALLDELRLREMAREGLIENEVLFQAAQSAGYRVSDEQLVTRIRKIPAFQENGTFSSAVYEQTLRNQGMRPGNFEPMLRRDLIIEQLQRGIEDTAFATTREVDEAVRLKRQQRDIGFLTISARGYEQKVTVSEEEIASYYDDNMQQFVSPERVSVDYLELSVDQLAKGIEVGDADLRAYFEEHKSSYFKPEQRRASHILITVASDADKTAVTEARNKAEELLKRIRAGESFSELARKFSQDPGSAREGGDLGFFGKGIMEPAFEKVAFSLKEGEVSDPVRTEFGFHIIKVTGIKPGGTPDFSKVRDQVAADYRHQQAEKRFYDAAEQLANLSYEHPDSLEPAAEQLGLEIQSTPLFGRSGGEEGIAADPKVVAAAFSPEVLEQDYNSEPVELSPVHMVVVHKKEHIPEQQLPLADVKQKIAEQLRHKKARDAAFAAAESIAHKAAEGEEIAVLAKERKLKWERRNGVTRNDTTLQQAIVRKAFRMPRPDSAAKPRYSAVQMEDDVAVIGLFGVKDGEPGSLDGKEFERERRALAASYGRSEYADLVKLLKVAADISRLKEAP